MAHRFAKPAVRTIVGTAVPLALAVALVGCGSMREIVGNTSVGSEGKGSTGLVAPDDSSWTTGEVGCTTVEGLGDPMDTEEYAHLEETGFVSARTRPLSTVSSDVDTASYCNVRRMLRDGATADEVPAGAVRIEELLNYFTYDYARPEGDDLFGATVHVGDCPWNEDTKLVTIGLATAPEASAIAERGSNLVFLVDVSGSMDSDDKLGLLKDAFAELVSHLGGNDRVSIVTYAGVEEVVLEGARGDAHAQIMRAMRGLRADGSTNGEAGLRMAYEVARRNHIKGGVNRIVMASDGDLNVGMSSESDLHDYVDRQRETGVYLSVLGFGSGNYKDNKMETLADHGNGSYHYIDCVEEAEKVLGSDLTANLVPLADDVRVQVEFNPALVKGYRLIGYENRAMADEDFRNDERDAGDVGPGSQFTVAYEVALEGSAQEVVETDLRYGPGSSGDGQSDEWLTATVRYLPADGGAASEQAWSVGEGDWSRDPGGDWRLQAAVIELGMMLRGSDHAGSSSYDGIRELLRGAGDVEGRDDLAELVDLARG
ncbi:MAG: von Willebrand factor type A domain-containing protein [Acidobacteriota bacterium]|nr:von Willebrand factor type A domain-containing protein [Acidobacteriota bacterium]